MRVRPHAGHCVGSEQTLLLQREQRYPPRVGREWHAHSVGLGSTIRLGKPIMRRLLLTPPAAEWGVVGGVVARMSRSR